MSELDELMLRLGILPESPIGRLAAALSERIDRLEAELREPPRAA